MLIRKMWGPAVIGSALVFGACDSGPEMPFGPADGTMGGDDGNGDGNGATGSPTGGTTGADSGAADTGSGGGPVMTKACVELVSDLESGETLIPEENGRQGAWFTFNDESEGGVQTPGEPFAPMAGGAPTSDGSVPETLFAARTNGTGFTIWGAGLGFNLNDEGCETDDAGACIGEPVPMPMVYDVSAWQGVSFYARSWGQGNGIPLTFKVVTQATVPVAEGGTCVPVMVDGAETGECDAPHQATMSVYKDAWRPFEILFSDISQPSYAGDNAIPFDATTVFALQWQVNQNVPFGEFDFAIDEVCFF